MRRPCDGADAGRIPAAYRVRFLAPGRALVVLVSESGMVENRVIDVPLDMPTSKMVEASNFLSSKLVDRSLAEARREIDREIAEHRATLDRSPRKSLKPDWPLGPTGATTVVS